MCSNTKYKQFILGACLTAALLPASIQAAYAQENVSNTYWQQIMTPTINAVNQAQQRQQQLQNQQARANQEQQARNQQFQKETLETLQQQHELLEHVILGPPHEAFTFVPRTKPKPGKKNPWLKNNPWQKTANNRFSGQQLSRHPEPKTAPQPRSIFTPHEFIKPNGDKPQPVNIFQ